MNDKINYIDFIFFIKVLKDKFIYFLILSIITLSIPVYLYLNNETEFTVSIIIESESSMKLSNIQRDWETLHTLADLEMPYIGQENSKNISLSAIVLSDFLAILTSPTKFNSIYQEFYENGKITETFEDTYKNFSVVFDERSFSKRKNILLVSFTSKSEEFSETFLFKVLNNAYSEVTQNLIMNFNDLVEVSQKYIFKEYTDDELKSLNLKNLDINSEFIIDFLQLQKKSNENIKLNDIKDNLKNIYSKENFSILLFSAETKQVNIKNTNVINQIVIYLAVTIILNYILFIFFVYKSRSLDK